MFVIREPVCIVCRCAYLETTIIGHISCSFGVTKCCVLHTYSGADKVLRSDLDANCFDMRSGLWTFEFGGSLDCLYYFAVESL